MLCVLPSLSAPAFGGIEPELHDGADPVVWGMDGPALLSRLGRSEYDVLRDLGADGHRLEEAVLLGQDATFALGLIYLELGMDELAERLLHLTALTAAEPWRDEAFRRLSARLRRDDRYEELEELALVTRELSPEGIEPELALLEARYRQERYAEVVATIEATRPRLAAAIPPTDPRAAEIDLWWAISLAETGNPHWAEALRALYRDHPAGPAHARVWGYLSSRPDLLAAFGREETQFFRAKQLLADWRSLDAARILISLISGSSGPSELVMLPATITDLYHAGARSRHYSMTAGAMGGLAAHLDDDLAAAAYAYAGRLYRLAGAHSTAIPLLGTSLQLRPDVPSTAWFRLSSMVRNDPLAAVSGLSALVPLPGDPASYSDIFIELAGRLAERERWDALLEAYEAISDFAHADALARYEITLARAFETGRLNAPADRAAEYRTLLLNRAHDQRADLFAALVSGALLGEDGMALLGIDPGEATGETAAQPGSGQTDDTRLARTYLRFGLTDELFAIVRRVGSTVDPATRIAAAERLADNGDSRRSILALTALERSGGVLTRQAAELRYPLAFSEIADARSSEEGVDRAVFYALIREESLFDPEIRSFAGAVGLAQLMPATAADIARRMRRAAPVLTDPVDSLSIGARYLSMLTSQFGTVARALAAYNAGQGNVRRWENRSTDLDEMLFHQAIPFAETYNHVRKVLVSAAYYGYLYDGRAPSDTVRLVFGL